MSYQGTRAPGPAGSGRVPLSTRWGITQPAGTVTECFFALPFLAKLIPCARRGPPESLATSTSLLFLSSSRDPPRSMALLITSHDDLLSVLGVAFTMLCVVWTLLARKRGLLTPPVQAAAPNRAQLTPPVQAAAPNRAQLEWQQMGSNGDFCEETPAATRPHCFQQQCGGGGDPHDDARASEAQRLAARLRAELGETVGAIGEKAIVANLLMRDKPSMLKADALRQCSTTRPSVKKYGDLLSRLQRQEPAPAAAHAVQSSEHLPAASLQPLVQPAWLREHTPSVTNLRVVGNARAADGTYHRVLRASIAQPSGAIERDATVVFDPSMGAAETNWKRQAQAVRELAAAWAEISAVTSNDELPASEPSKGVNIVRVNCYCNWRAGDWVWIPQDPAASYTLPVAAAADHPTLAKVVRSFANGSIEVVMFDLIDLCFDESDRHVLPPCRTAFEMQQQAMHLFSRRPRYVGEVVRLVRKASYTDVWIKDEFDEWACESRVAEGGEAMQLVRRSPAEAWRATGKRHPSELGWRILPSSIELLDDGRVSLDDLGVAGIATSFDFAPDLAKIVAIDLEREVCVNKGNPSDTFCDSDTITFGTVDVVLFNPFTMQYDGPQIVGVPLTPCVTALGLAAPLAEVRTIAIAHVCNTAAGQLREQVHARIERIGALDDVQAIANELDALPHSDEPCRLIVAREFEVQQANAIEQLIREQAVQQLAQTTVGNEWPPVSACDANTEPVPLTLATAQQVAHDLSSAYFAWNEATADPSFTFPRNWLYARGTVSSICPRSGAKWLPFEGQTLNDYLCAPFGAGRFDAGRFRYPFPNAVSESESDDEERHVPHAPRSRNYVRGSVEFKPIRKAADGSTRYKVIFPDNFVPKGVGRCAEGCAESGGDSDADMGQQYGGGASAAGESGEESEDESDDEGSVQYLQPWSWAPEPEPEWEWG